MLLAIRARGGIQPCNNSTPFIAGQLYVGVRSVLAGVDGDVKAEWELLGEEQPEEAVPEW